LHLACIVAGLAASRLAARRASPQVLWAGTWLTWGALGVVSAMIAPGTCFLFVVPTFVAGFIAWLEIDLAAALPALVAAVLWLPIAILAVDGLGLVIPAVACISSTLLVTTLPPLGARPDGTPPPRWHRRLGLAAAAVVVALVLAATLVPVYSAEAPQRVNVVFRQDDAWEGSTPSSRVFVEAAWATMPWGKPPEAMVRALGEPSSVRSAAVLLPGAPRVPYAEVRRIDVAPPTAEVLSSTPRGNGKMVRVRLASPRGARTLVVELPPDGGVHVLVEGETALPRNGLLVLRAVPAEGVVLDIAIDGGRRAALTLLDVTPGLPSPDAAPVAHDVLRARDARGVQTQEGDVTLVARHVDL
jgi:hypothetical protein